MAQPIHVVSHGDEWAVRRQGDDDIISVWPTQKQAEDEGRRIAKDDQAEFELHGLEGRIRERDSYGNDPRSSEG
jgi:hypothetical protein